MARAEKEKKIQTLLVELETAENSESELYRKATWAYLKGRYRVLNFHDAPSVMSRTCSILMSIDHSHVIKVMHVLRDYTSIIYESFEKTLDHEKDLRDKFFVELGKSEVAMTNCFQANLKGIISALIEIRRNNMLDDICTDTLCQLPHMAVDKDMKIKLIITATSSTKQKEKKKQKQLAEGKKKQLANLRRCLYRFISTVCSKCQIKDVNKMISVLHDFSSILSSTREEFQGDVFPKLLKHPLLLNHLEKKYMLFEAFSWWKQDSANELELNMSVIFLDSLRGYDKRCYIRCSAKLIETKEKYLTQRLVLSEDDLKKNEQIEIENKTRDVKKELIKPKVVKNGFIDVATLLRNLLMHGWEPKSKDFPYDPITKSEAEVVSLFEKLFPSLFVDLYKCIYFSKDVKKGQRYESVRGDSVDRRYPKGTQRYY